MTDQERYFIHKIRVYYADTDAGGIVYHARYLEFAERCRSELLRHISHPLISDGGNQFVVRKSQIEWRAPARLDDLLVCRTGIEDIRGARVTMRHEMLLGDSAVTVMVVELAYVTASHKPVRLPEALISAMRQFAVCDAGKR